MVIQGLTSPVGKALKVYGTQQFYADRIAAINAPKAQQSGVSDKVSISTAAMLKTADTSPSVQPSVKKSSDMKSDAITYEKPDTRHTQAQNKSALLPIESDEPLAFIF